MAISKSTNTYNRQNWEQSEFPILCQTCLGDNPYLRMLKDNYGDECKVCSRPFTVFRWCPGARMRYKKTEVCQACAQLKNVCQTCLLDLEFGLPVQVRDQAIGMKDDLPKNDINREYFMQSVDKQLAETGGTQAAGALGKAQAPSDVLMRLARTTPYYKRNRPHICSFWVKGECKRGEECPYRHEMPTDPEDPLSQQNLKDRYYGVNDPVAEKLMRHSADLPHLVAPEDKSITSLYVGGVDEGISEKDLSDYFYQFGELRSVHLVTRQKCAFITFTTREAAEKAAETSFNKLIIKGRRLRILWGKAQSMLPAPGKKGGMDLSPVPGLPDVLPPFDPFNLHQQTELPPPPSINPPRRAYQQPVPPPPPPTQQQRPAYPPPMMPPPQSNMMPPPQSTMMPPPQYMLPPPPPPGAPPPHAAFMYGQMPPPPPMMGGGHIHYPSQNPLHLGAKAPHGN
ncbi:hypothetical protein EMCRGX_G022693 [Ephydatia muelleri]